MAEDKKKKPGLVDDSLQGLTFKVIGLAMAVHNDLGPGHRERTYHNAMSQRFADAGMEARSEPRIPILDENGNMVNFYEPDHQVTVELLAEYKAHGWSLTNDEIAQCIDYFAGTEAKVILLLNFGRPRLEWKRLFPPNHIREQRRKRWSRKRDSDA
ncbi:MAG: GxxExxY protein [Chloroflexi bacterium]|nr:GxxExxY protein [Chloroflexota bacterium]